MAGLRMSGIMDFSNNQLTTIAWLRWRMFVHSLRTKRGQLELFSYIVVGFALSIGGFGGAFGMAVAASLMTSAGKPELIAILFWFVFIFWQLFPIMATAFAGDSDPTGLLRFPLDYRSYFLVRLVFGAFDPATALGSLWSFGILVGTSFAKPALLAWIFLVTAVFIVFNLVFMQMIFAYVERWLAQRRTREIMGVLFLVLLLSFQLIGPLAQRFDKHSRPGLQGDLQKYAEWIMPVQGILPPGLAADAISQAMQLQPMKGISSLVLLSAFTLVAGYFLHVRLRAQYRGENLSEAAAASVRPKDRSLRLGWKIPGLPTAAAAIFQKEVSYLLRSGPMLLNLIMPIFALLIFRFGAMNAGRHSGTFLARTPGMAFPAAAAYALLMLTNQVCNNFGGDGAGIQFFYASPVNFHEIVLAKNLFHAAVLAIEAMVAWLAVSILYGSPALSITVAALAGLLFAAPVNFAVGNLLSFYSPKKVDYSSFRRQNPPQLSALIILGVQFFVVSVGAAVFWTARRYGNFWIATLILLLLAGISIFVYRLILGRIDQLAIDRRDTLVAELCRA